MHKYKLYLSDPTRNTENTNKKFEISVYLKLEITEENHRQERS